MNKNEVVDLLETIDAMYPGKLKPTDFKRTLDEWSAALEPFDESLIRKNLNAHRYVSAFLPTIADLVKKDAGVRTHVPDAQATQDFLDRYKTAPETDPEVVEAAKREIRRLLGIRRGGDSNE